MGPHLGSPEESQEPLAHQVQMFANASKKGEPQPWTSLVFPQWRLTHRVKFFTAPLMLKQERADFIRRRLEELYPETPVPLDHKDPFHPLSRGSAFRPVHRCAGEFGDTRIVCLGR